jgi:CubicO group peptidase (beta-lactamase class C family)
LRQARVFSESTATAAVIVVHGGVIVDEWGETTRKFDVHSVRKSFLSALYGIFVDRGKIQLDSTLEDLGINDRLGLTHEERQARVVDLLRARSGVYHPANVVAEDDSRRWPKRGSHKPGTFWFYNNWDFNALGTIFEKQTGLGIFKAFDTLIAQPIGMEDYTPADGMYEPRSGFGGAQGRPVSDHQGYAFHMSARDMARFGLLYLRKGRWAGEQVVPEQWVDRTTQTEEKINQYGGYEFLWWIAIDGQLYPGVNLGKGAYAALGSGGHYIVIVPQYDLVVVHRVDNESRNKPYGGAVAGPSVSAAQFGKLLQLILDARPT